MVLVICSAGKSIETALFAWLISLLLLLLFSIDVLDVGLAIRFDAKICISMPPSSLLKETQNYRINSFMKILSFLNANIEYHTQMFLVAFYWTFSIYCQIQFELGHTSHAVLS